MELKLFLSLLLLTILSTFSQVSIFAETDQFEVVLKKQAEVDSYLFGENNEELTKKGITVTHTASLENKVEIGITPYNEENARYFHEVFGDDNIIVVEGVQAHTMEVGVGTSDNQTSGAEVYEPAQTMTLETATTQRTGPVMDVVYIISVILMVVGFVIVLIKKRLTTSN